MKDNADACASAGSESEPHNHVQNESVLIPTSSDKNNDSTNEMPIEQVSTIGPLEEFDIQLPCEEDVSNEVITNGVDGLTEISDLGILSDTAEMRLRKPNEVYREMYKTAIAKAKRLRQVALEAYLDAKKIKARFMLDELGDPDDSASEYEEEEVEIERT